MKPTVLIDKDIPFLQGVLEPYAHVQYLSTAQWTPQAVRPAQALLIRTRTRCHEALLSKSSLSFIGTATIGCDHIDAAYCAARGIEVIGAPGCNSGAVLQYVATVLYHWSRCTGRALRGTTLGVVGVGHIGSKVVRLAREAGMDVLCCDPPRARAEGPQGFCSLEEVAARAHILTFHVPLLETTREMVNQALLASLRPGTALINTSRGEVICEPALRQAAGRLGWVVLDVWTHEPQIDLGTLAVTQIATPHIAGYSLEGKRNATQTLVRALAAHFDWEPLKAFTLTLPPPPTYAPAHIIPESFPIFVQDKILREAPHLFEAQRNQYTLRREWTPAQYSTVLQCLQQPLQKTI